MNLRKATYTQNGERKVSKKAYADFFDHNGVRRRMPLFASEKNSAEALRAIRRLVSVRASDDVLTPELQRFVENTLPRIRQKLVDWEIIDSSLLTTSQTLAELVDEWAETLLGNGVGED